MNKTKVITEDDLLNGYEMENLSLEEIDILIAKGELTEEDIIWFYHNSQWRDVL